MRISKKILSIVLAVLMLVSICLVPSTAAAPLDGTEDANKINVKYEVEQVNSAWDGFLTTEGNDIYAVSVYAKAQYGINVLQVPIYFDADLFAPIMWMDDDPVNNGALGYDGWYADMADGLVYDYVSGDAWNDASWYRSTGQAATSVGNARFIGLGNSNASVIQYQVEYVESTNTAKYDAYDNVPDDNFDGYMYINFVNATSKTAYMNAMENAVNKDYVRYATIYFMRQEGVSAEDCVGAQFGWAEGGDWLTQTNWDVSGNPSYFASTYKTGNPGANYVSNAVVGGSETPVAPDLTVKYFKDQIRFQKNGADYAGKFDYRILAEIDNFDEVFEDIDDAKARITDVGFVFNKGAAIELDKAKAQVEGGAATYSQVKNIYISTSYDKAEYVIACLVTNIPDADKGTNLSALAYVIYEQDGVTKYAYFDAVQTSPFTTLYNEYYSQAFPA